MLKENRRIELKLPKELEMIFGSSDYNHDGWLVQKNLFFSEDKLQFDFVLHLGDEERTQQQWQMVVEGYKTSRFYPEKLGAYFQFYDNHFLLWEFQNIWTELYTKKASVNPETLLANLCVLHQKSFGSFLPFGCYFNGANNWLELCGSGFGLFSRGPAKILALYYDCLQSAGTEPYFLGQFNPDVENSELKLLIIGDCYFIGNDFHFKRSEKD
jgi:hypothetical protein